VLRLKDIWYATRDVVETMRERTCVARISGWGLVDTDKASATTRDHLVLKGKCHGQGAYHHSLAALA
jgi:hypothetical protein